MLKLRNITMNNDTIAADYYPEDGSDVGHLVIDKETSKVVSVKKSTLDFYDGVDVSFYFPHARRGLREILKSVKEGGEIPKERTIMWY